jgi:endoglucanase
MKSAKTELLTFLNSLLTSPGLSGHEGPIREVIEPAWRPVTDEISLSRLGSLHGLKKGSASKPRPTILIGVIVQPPAHLLPVGARKGPVPLKYLLVDTGLRPQRVKNLVRTGDLISFAQEPIQLQGDTLVGHSLDNRASVAALTLCLDELQKRNHAWDVWVVATVQEEETMGGARTSAFQLRPQLAIAVDVTWGKSTGTPDHKTFALGKGPTLGLGPNIHPGLHRSFKELADNLEIPYAVEVMPRHSGTDAYAMQVAAEGIPTMVVSIPLRYMHTPVEVVALKDIRRTAHLLSEFIAHLESDYMEELTLDEQT